MRFAGCSLLSNQFLYLSLFISHLSPFSGATFRGVKATKTAGDLTIFVMKITLKKKAFIAGSAAFLFFVFAIVGASAQQPYIPDMKRQSARSDKLTGGTIEKTALAPGQGNLKITVNVPSFQMTLWQNGKEVKTYPIGVGLKDYPIFIGLRQASAVIWNPVWIPPDSDWVHAS